MKYIILVLILFIGITSHTKAAETKKAKKNLKVVLIMGQLNMVGMCKAISDYNHGIQLILDMKSLPKLETDTLRHHL